MVCFAKLVPVISWQIVTHLSQIYTNVARSCQKGSEPPEVLSFRLIIKAKFNPCLCRYIKASPSVCSLLLTNSNALHKSQTGEKGQIPQKMWAE